MLNLRSNPIRAGRPGFTLMEVMAALAICSLGLFSVIQVVQAGAAASRGAVERRIAMLIAEEEMLRFELTEYGFDDPFQGLGGEAKPMILRYEEYHVETLSEAAELPFESDVDLRQLSVKVSWGSKDSPREYVLTNYLIVDKEVEP